MSIELAYAELGLPLGASESEVRAAWRRLVSRWHPDRNASADAVNLMQRINSAYERIKLAAFAGPSDRPPDGKTPGASRQAEPQGRTLRRKVRLSLEEAALGCTKVLRGKLTDTCAACIGHGVLKPEAPCPGCDGAGTVRGSAWFGWLPTQSTCEACEGSGVLRRICPACEGQGECTSAYRRTVRMPAGVRQGDVLSAEGTDDRHADFDGTLELHVEIAKHKLFMVGDDGTLRCEMPVDGFAWIAGAWIDVPTLTGLQQMRLQRGRHVYRLRGQGLPLERRSTARGDYLVSVVPTFPDVLSVQQEALLDQLASSSVATDGHSAAGPVRAWRRAVHTWDRSRSR
ncbi:MAG: molecular chaperone DnaJ [Betaproteobacteria bacterium]|nr:MAG: molecular chaperone DnaJ [Betaproteobacteria bacterium]